MYSIQETARRLSAEPAVIKALIDKKFLRPTSDGMISGDQIAAIIKNNALSAILAKLRKETAEQEQQAAQRAHQNEVKRDDLLRRISKAKASGDYKTAAELYERMEEFQNLNSVGVDN